MATIHMLGSGILLVTAAVVGLIFLKMKPNTLPPGPKGVPLFGNIMDLPPKGKREWEHWLIHKDSYGPISSVTALGTTIVILHSAELALELLEKRSLIYSARPNFVFADLVGWSKSLAMLQYNKTHRLYRKLAHTMIGTQAAVLPYLALQEKEVHRFLFRVLKEPELLFHYMKTESGAIILKIVYGYTVEPHKPDPLVQLADKAMMQFAASTVPGSWMVDIIPSLKYIPEWMPGTGWKKTMKEWRATLEETAEKPLQFAQRRIANGDPVKSFVADFHNNKGDNHTPEDHEALKWTALTMYGGGSDTTVSTLMSFFLTMILFPDVQRKAQEEIDRVIGNVRLPTFRDRESLPYVDAVVKEAWRWHPVTPMGVPHATAAEDVVNGYRIPKGAIVMTNIWWLTHDPAVYPDPLVFDPLRYLCPNPAPDPTNHIFGHGRRICPGQYLAISSVWLTIAQSLAVFDISRGLDENGHEIEPTVEFSPSIISHPEPYKATIKPRSPEHQALILQLEELYPWEESNAHEL